VPDDDVPDLGPVPERFPVTEDLARRLVTTQFPQWADLPVRRVAREGWDNQTFHLGEEMSVRMPSGESYAQAVEKEQRWLPVFADLLPLQIPVPLTQGVPGEGYPFAWSVYRWLDGEAASRDAIDDLTGFATSLAAFLADLQSIDPTGGPEPGLHNWYRGGTLATYDGLARDALVALEGRCRTDLAGEIWATARSSRWHGPPVWFHGDMAVGNLLLRGGELAAVIDFGTCGVGDPACDLAIAWTLLTGESRAAFRSGLDLDEDTWVRGRGWALWKTLTECAYALDEDEAELSAAMAVLDRVLDEG
jgi:aminoglycoside phosphotransferase (APT) family kinase protein